MCVDVVASSGNLDGYVNGENILVNDKQIKLVMSTFADYIASKLRQTNPRFNWDKFVKACGF